MKRIYTAIIALMAFLCVNAQGSFTAKSNFAITLSGGSSKSYGYVNFAEGTSDDTWSLSLTSVNSSTYSSSLDISKIESISINSLEDRLAAYKSPTYPDYYCTFADWSSSSSWNLANIHDPTVMRAEDGYYYMFQTDASFGGAMDGQGHFYCRRSKNLVEWELLGAPMQSVPEWVGDKLNEIRVAMGLSESTYDLTDDSNFGFWAPCARKVEDGLYRLYYSITGTGYLDPGTTSWSERCFIGLMETATPWDVESWEDKGFVITNASDKGLNFYVSPTSYQECYYKFNAIDPSYIITPDGEHWLIYGSWHSGIAAVQLDPSTGKTLEELGDPWGDSDEEIAEYGTLIYTRESGNRWQGSEGPEIIYHDGYYYLFLAYDALDVAYNTRVCRAETITGPYYDINGNNVTSGADTYPIATHPYKFSDNYGWVGISHCAIFTDGDDNWFYASQARLPADITIEGELWSSNYIMQGQIRKIIWDENGWPVVMPECYSAVPQAAISSDELVGDWEMITISYSYGNQQESFALTINEDGTITSTWNNGRSWSFDTDEKVLTIAGSLDLQVMRETDWDVDPSDRVPTIIFAGYNTNGKTYWGKKVTETE